MLSKCPHFLGAKNLEKLNIYHGSNKLSVNQKMKGLTSFVSLPLSGHLRKLAPTSYFLFHLQGLNFLAPLKSLLHPTFAERQKE